METQKDGQSVEIKEANVLSNDSLTVAQAAKEIKENPSIAKNMEKILTFEQFLTETKQYVDAKFTDDYKGPDAGKKAKLNALDYTSKGDDDDVEVNIGGKKIKVQKKFIQPIELFETGVYNSENDIQANPKTAENKPDKIIGVLAAIADKVTEVLYSLEDLRTFIKNNSELSHQIVDTSIAEFKSFLSSLQSESEVVGSDSVNTQ